MASNFAASCDQKFEMVTLPQAQESFYQALTGEGENSLYTAVGTEASQVPNKKLSKNFSDTNIYQSIPSLSLRSQGDYESYSTTASHPENLITQSNALKTSKKSGKYGNRKVFLTLGTIFLVALLLSTASLVVSVLSSINTKVVNIQQESPQKSVHNNSSIITELVERINVLERLTEVTSKNDTVHQFEPDIDALIAELNKTGNSLLSNIVFLLQSKTKTLEKNFNSIQSTLAATNSQLAATNTKLTTTSSGVNSLRSSLKRVNLFSECIKNESSCTISPLNTNLFACNTPGQSINMSVSCYVYDCYMGRTITRSVRILSVKFHQ